MRARFHSFWGSRMISGAIALLAGAVAVPSFGQLAAPVAPRPPGETKRASRSDSISRNCDRA